MAKRQKMPNLNPPRVTPKRNAIGAPKGVRKNDLEPVTVAPHPGLNIYTVKMVPSKVGPKGTMPWPGGTIAPTPDVEPK